MLALLTLALDQSTRDVIIILTLVFVVLILLALFFRRIP